MSLRHWLKKDDTAVSSALPEGDYEATRAPNKQVKRFFSVIGVEKGDLTSIMMKDQTLFQ